MSTAQQQVTAKALEITDFYLENARRMWGVPQKPVKPADDSQPVPLPQPASSSPSSGSPAAAPAAAGLPGWAKAALVAGVSLGSIGAGAGVTSYFSKPTIVQPSEKTGSLLQYLQDSGQHLPEKTP